MTPLGFVLFVLIGAALCAALVTGVLALADLVSSLHWRFFK